MTMLLNERRTNFEPIPQKPLSNIMSYSPMETLEQLKKLPKKALRRNFKDRRDMGWGMFFRHPPIPLLIMYWRFRLLICRRNPF